MIACLPSIIGPMRCAAFISPSSTYRPNASRPILRCRPRAQYEVHELPLFAEKSRSCRVVHERSLVQHEQVASKKNNLHELIRVLYVIATRRLCYDELNVMPLGWRCDENQFNIFSIDLFSSAASVTVARSIGQELYSLT